MIPKSSQNVKLVRVVLVIALLSSGSSLVSKSAQAGTTAANAGSLTNSINSLVGGSGGISNAVQTANQAANGASDLLHTGTGGISNIQNGIGSLLGGHSSQSVDQIFQGLSQLQQSLDPSKLFSEVISPIQSLISQIGHLKDHALDELLSVLQGRDGGNGQASDASRTLKAAMGALNLPDPAVIAQGIEEIAGTKRGERVILSGVNAANQEAIALSSANAQTSRMAAGQVLSREAQDASKAQLEQVAKSAADAVQQFSANVDLSNESQQAGTLSSASAQQSGTAAQQVAQLSQTAQSQVSTQDVLKSQIQVSAAQSNQLRNLSDQATAASAQSAVQSAQLGNVSGQLASSNQIEAYQSLQLQQANIGIATQNQTLADLSEADQGRRQEAIVNASSEVRRNNAAWSKVGLLH